MSDLWGSFPSNIFWKLIAQNGILDAVGFVLAAAKVLIFPAIPIWWVEEANTPDLQYGYTSDDKNERNMHIKTQKV